MYCTYLNSIANKALALRERCGPGAKWMPEAALPPRGPDVHTNEAPVLRDRFFIYGEAVANAGDS